MAGKSVADETNYGLNGEKSGFVPPCKTMKAKTGERVALENAASVRDESQNAAGNLPVARQPNLETQLEDWTVEEVYGYVYHLGPGFADSALKFLCEEIDGAALVLLSPEQMVREPMLIKLGPALKIGKAIEALKRKRRTS